MKGAGGMTEESLRASTIVTSIEGCGHVYHEDLSGHARGHVGGRELSLGAYEEGVDCGGETKSGLSPPLGVVRDEGSNLDMVYTTKETIGSEALLGSAIGGRASSADRQTSDSGGKTVGGRGATASRIGAPQFPDVRRTGGDRSMSDHDDHATAPPKRHRSNNNLRNLFIST